MMDKHGTVHIAGKEYHFVLAHTGNLRLVPGPALSTVTGDPVLIANAALRNEIVRQR